MRGLDDLKIKEMKKVPHSDWEWEIPEDIINEIIILHSIGVSIEDLKYLLDLRLNNY